SGRALAPGGATPTVIPPVASAIPLISGAGSNNSGVSSLGLNSRRPVGFVFMSRNSHQIAALNFRERPSRHWRRVLLRAFLESGWLPDRDAGAAVTRIL